MAQHITHTAAQTQQLGLRLGQALHGGELLVFTGGLGAGKTTFCSGIAQGLGCIDAVSSPTFAIANLYRGPIPFAHFDLYRIAGLDDLETAGFYDYLDTGAVVAVEWSEKLPDLGVIPDIFIHITHGGEDTREFLIEGADGL